MNGTNQYGKHHQTYTDHTRVCTSAPVGFSHHDISFNTRLDDEICAFLGGAGFLALDRQGMQSSAQGRKDPRQDTQDGSSFPIFVREPRTSHVLKSVPYGADAASGRNTWPHMRMAAQRWCSFTLTCLWGATM
nr:hypothetical protein CFP56_55015 [Quercus suber]